MIYELRVENGLDPSWSSWFDGMHISQEPNGLTVISGHVTDSAALHGLLTKIHDLGLALVSVRRVDTEGNPA